MHSRLQQSDRMPGGRAERAVRPCPFVGEGAAKSIDLQINGYREREKCPESFYSISVPEAEAVLGQPFLGEGVLRRHGGIGCGHDTQVCEVSGEAGTAPDSDESGQMISNGATQASLLRRLAFQPPYRGHKASLRSTNADL